MCTLSTRSAILAPRGFVSRSWLLWFALQFECFLLHTNEQPHTQLINTLMMSYMPFRLQHVRTVGHYVRIFIHRHRLEVTKQAWHVHADGFVTGNQNSIYIVVKQTTNVLLSEPVCWSTYSSYLVIPGPGYKYGAKLPIRVCGADSHPCRLWYDASRYANCWSLCILHMACGISIYWCYYGLVVVCFSLKLHCSSSY